MTFLQQQSDGEIGQTYGRLRVVRRASDMVDKNGVHYKKYLCVCECGVTTAVTMSNLHSGGTTSCGCLAREKFAERVTSHGMSYSRPYKIWTNMKGRCLNPRSELYPRYGGRGIELDPSWEDFEVFWNDMRESYADDLTIDRIDNERGYTKENCRWATVREQNLNQGRSLDIYVNGVNISLEELGRLFRVNRRTLYSRLLTWGWDLEKALAKPSPSMGTAINYEYDFR